MSNCKKGEIMNVLKMLAVTALVSTLTACPLINTLLSSFHSITVYNNCGGTNSTVNFYLDGTFKGAVTYSRTFFGVLEGTHFLRAEGTGFGGVVFERSQFVGSDGDWTLCSRSKEATPQDNQFRSSSEAH